MLENKISSSVVGRQERDNDVQLRMIALNHAASASHLKGKDEVLKEAHAYLQFLKGEDPKTGEVNHHPV